MLGNEADAAPEGEAAADAAVAGVHGNEADAAPASEIGPHVKAEPVIERMPNAKFILRLVAEGVSMRTLAYGDAYGDIYSTLIRIWLHFSLWRCLRQHIFYINTYLVAL